MCALVRAQGELGQHRQVPVSFFHMDPQALLDQMLAISAQLTSIEDRLVRIEAELRSRERG